MRVCECARACVYMWSVSVVCVFPLQVVLPTCLCSWFCLLPVYRWFGDALGGGNWSHKLLSAEISVTLSSMPWSFSFYFYFSLSFPFYLLRPTPSWLPYLRHFCLPNPLHLFVSFASLNLCPSFSLSHSLSFLHHKHFQRWHTRVDSHPESSATTIMSMLSSHNNTRITCWGRQALLGAGPQTWLPWIESVNTTQTCTCWSEKYGVEFPHYVLFLDRFSAVFAIFLLYFCVRGWDVIVRC